MTKIVLSLSLSIVIVIVICHDNEKSNWKTLVVKKKEIEPWQRSFCQNFWKVRLIFFKVLSLSLSFSIVICHDNGKSNWKTLLVKKKEIEPWQRSFCHCHCQLSLSLSFVMTMKSLIGKPWLWRKRKLNHDKDRFVRTFGKFDWSSSKCKTFVLWSLHAGLAWPCMDLQKLFELLGWVRVDQNK